MDDREIKIVRRMLLRSHLTEEQALGALMQIMVDTRVHQTVEALRPMLVEQIASQMQSPTTDAKVPRPAKVRAVGGRSKVARQLRIDVEGPMKMLCPECKASRGEPCRDAGGEMTQPHESRLEIFRATEVAEPRLQPMAG